MAVDTTPKAEVFSLRVPYLSEGRSNDVVARTEKMWLTMKVYSQGGENALHTHTTQDHAFIVLEGQATFHDEKGDTRVVDKNHGILLPAGAYYWFQSSGDTNLVLLRVAARTGAETGGDDRIKPDGQPLPGDSAENKHIDGVPVPGRFFGE